jgi:hypothetical protein
MHWPSYYTIWNQGIATTRTVSYRFSPLRLRPGADLPEFVDFRQELTYNGQYADVDYILVKGDPGVEGARTLARFELDRAAGPWSLYRRTSAGPLSSTGP